MDQSLHLLAWFICTPAAGTRTIVIPHDGEADQPVAPVTEETVLLPERAQDEGQINLFSFERFIFSWLGIGHFYCKN